MKASIFWWLMMFVFAFLLCWFVAEKSWVGSMICSLCITVCGKLAVMYKNKEDKDEG